MPRVDRFLPQREGREWYDGEEVEDDPENKGHPERPSGFFLGPSVLHTLSKEL